MTTLQIKEPKQRRSREVLERIVDTALASLAETVLGRVAQLRDWAGPDSAIHVALDGVGSKVAEWPRGNTDLERPAVPWEIRRYAARALIDGTRRVEFDNVEVINGGPMLWCRIDGMVVAVPSLRLLPGTQVRRAGDLGRLILSEDVAADLGLLPRP